MSLMSGTPGVCTGGITGPGPGMTHPETTTKSTVITAVTPAFPDNKRKSCPFNFMYFLFLPLLPVFSLREMVEFLTY